MVGLTVTETNKVLEDEPKLPFRENTASVKTDSDGSFSDVVTARAQSTSEKVSGTEAREIIRKQIENRTHLVTEQTLTISAPGQGVIATAVYRRTFTNLDEKGNHRSTGGRVVNNFRVSATAVTVSRPKSP